jgi:hypothetical protein
VSATDDPTGTVAPPSDPIRICRKCSTQSQTAGDFCPHCGARYTKRKRSKKGRALLFGLPSALLIVAAIVAVALVVHHNNQVAAHNRQVAARKHAAVVAAAQKAAAARAKRLAAAKLARQLAQAEKRLENSERASLVSSLQSAVKKSAVTDVTNGLLDGPILKVQCQPASAVDATAKIATYTCLAATSITGTTLHGYDFTGTINLNTSDITWRLGNG